ncbi:retrovirus-related pol polyprotein from transposon TNT 1-94 [Tanacetum coccineum]
MTTLAEHMIVAGADNCPPKLKKSMYDFWQSRMLLYIKGKEHGRMVHDSFLNDPLDWGTIKANGFLPSDVYSLVNHQNVAKEIWDRVSLQPEWRKFVTDVKLAKDLHTTNYDQLYAYLSQHEAHANEVLTQLSHTTPSVPQNAYHAPPISQQPQAEFPQLDSGLAVLSFLPADDPIACLNKAMAVMSTVMASRTKGNATSSGGNNAASQARVVKCYNCQGKGHMARQCNQPKRPRNSAWFKEKMLLDCDDISSAKAVIMANLSSYDSDVLFECSVDKKYFDIQKKEFFLDNDRLLEHIICQDVMNIVMHDDFVSEIVLRANNKCLVNDNLEVKRLIQENDHLFELLLSQDIVHICVNSLAKLTNYGKMEQDYINEYNETSSIQ